MAGGTERRRKELRVVDEGLEQERNACWRTFLAAHAAAIERIERDLAEEGLMPLSWYDVLLALYEAPERKLRMHELASAILITRGGLTRLVARIEKAGLLRREPDPVDGRGAAGGGGGRHTRVRDAKRKQRVGGKALPIGRAP